MYHYVYYSYEPWGRGYIGVRSCKVVPQDDVDYFGSFKDKTFKPTEKIIIQEFKTRKEAAEAEIALHNFYEIQINTHFANKAKSTCTGFSIFGTKRPPEVIEKVSKALKGRKMPKHLKEKFSKIHVGRKQSPEWIQKRVQKLKGKKRTDEHKKRMSLGHKNKARPHFYKPVKLICNKTGEILKFDSQKQAIKELNLQQSNFCNMVNGRRRSCGGYSIFID